MWGLGSLKRFMGFYGGFRVSASRLWAGFGYRLHVGSTRVSYVGLT